MRALGEDWDIEKEVLGQLLLPASPTSPLSPTPNTSQRSSLNMASLEPTQREWDMFGYMIAASEFSGAAVGVSLIGKSNRYATVLDPRSKRGTFLSNTILLGPLRSLGISRDAY
jgi:hypothetical protein